MKVILLTAAALSAAAAPALAQSAPEVEIKNAVARVAVIVEDRSDVGIEVEQGASSLPALNVERRGRDIHVDGGLGRRVGALKVGDRIQNCRSGSRDAVKAGDGAAVQVRDLGWINAADAPLIVIRTPRNVNVSAGGAIWGSVGRGATSIDLANGGCGAWDVANTDGRVAVAIGGSGNMRVGTSQALEVSIGGSGSVSAGATRDLEVSIGGSGDVDVAQIDGNIEVSIGGSGDVNVRQGSAPKVDISIAGSGDVRFGGTAGDVDVAMVGGGDVEIARATGQVSRSIMGGGDVRIGR